MSTDSWGSSKTRGNVVFNFRGDAVRDIAPFAAGYRRAARAVLDKVMSQPGYRDNDCYPIFYLYRHSLELYLKAIIIKGAELMDLVSNESICTKLICSSHKLTVFMPTIEAIFRNRGWLADSDGTVDPSYGDICDVVTRVDAIDPRSSSFRYPINQQHNSLHEHHFVLNVVEYARDLDHVLGLLDAACMGLEVECDWAKETLYEVQEILRKCE